MGIFVNKMTINTCNIVFILSKSHGTNTAIVIIGDSFKVTLQCLLFRLDVKPVLI